MKTKIKETTHLLLALLALCITFTACHNELTDNDAISHNGDMITITSLQVGIENGTATAPRAADKDGYEGVVKKNFVEGDVIHIAVRPKDADGSVDNANASLSNATLGADGQWTLSPALTLPADKTNISSINTFYDGTNTQFGDYNEHISAYNAAMGYTTTDNGPTIIDVLLANGHNTSSSWTNSSGTVNFNASGVLSLAMEHINSLLRISSITNRLGVEVDKVSATVQTYNSNDNTPKASKDLTFAPLSTATEGASGYECMAPRRMGDNSTYLTTLTVTLANGQVITISVPNSDGSTHGQYIGTNNSYTYRLTLLPGSCTATLVSSDGTGWEDKDTGHIGVPEGYTPIYTKEDLMAVKNNLAGNYILMADIDLTPASANPTSVTEGLWEPIGDGSNPFTGKFNGNGHIVKGMTIKGSYMYAGFFGRIESNGLVYNLHLREVSVTNTNAWSYVGALAGSNSGTITLCSAKGDVSSTGTNEPYAGGLVGYNNAGTITRSWASGNVSSGNSSGSSYAGGLVGNTNYRIISCYALNSVVTATTSSSSNSSYAGGLVGHSKSISGSSTTIYGCYASGVNVNATNSSGSHYAGALVGYVEISSSGRTTIASCYATNQAATEGATSPQLLGYLDNQAAAEKFIFNGCISPLAEPGTINNNGSNILNGNSISNGYAPLTEASTTASISRIITVVVSPSATQDYLGTVIPAGGLMIDINAYWQASSIWPGIDSSTTTAPRINMNYAGDKE